MKYLIARHQNGITINPFEFVLDYDGNEMKFNSVDEACVFLNTNTDEVLTIEQWEESGIYIINEDELRGTI